MTENAVEEALYYLLGQDYRGRTTFDQRGKGTHRSSQWTRRQTAYVADEDFDDEAYYETADFYGDDADDTQYDEVFESNDVLEFERRL